MIASPHTTRRRTSTLDDESQAILYGGANMSQLAIAFRCDHRTLQQKLHGVPATGSRNGTETWHLHVAAPHLVKPTEDIETYLKKMHHNDLPKHLSKEFWAAIKLRQEVQLADGDLWPTDRVVGVIGGLMKLMKMAVRLMSDNVDQQSELSDKQRRTVKQLGDGMLEHLFTEVREAFKPKKDRNDKPLPVSTEVTKMSERLTDLLRLDDKTYDRLLRLAHEENDEL